MEAYANEACVQRSDRGRRCQSETGEGGIDRLRRGVCGRGEEGEEAEGVRASSESGVALGRFVFRAAHVKSETQGGELETGAGERRLTNDEEEMGMKGVGYDRGREEVGRRVWLGTVERGTKGERGGEIEFGLQW